MKRRRKSKATNPGSTAVEESPPSEAEFSFALTKVAVSQVCRSVGLRTAEFSALETLTLIATKYIQLLGGAGASLSNASNRTESNLFDVANGLRDLSSSCNRFSGCSATDATCLIRSNVLRNLSDFVSTFPEIPFAKPVPRRRNGESISYVPHAPRQVSHIPVWLPSFPDTSLYSESSSHVKQWSDHLWEDSDPVRNSFFSEGETPRKIAKYDGCGGRSGGEMSERKDKVSFKLGKRVVRRATARVEAERR